MALPFIKLSGGVKAFAVVFSTALFCVTLRTIISKSNAGSV
jgi:hypothetical protein